MLDGLGLLLGRGWRCSRLELLRIPELGVCRTAGRRNSLRGSWRVTVFGRRGSPTAYGDGWIDDGSDR